MTTNNHPAHGPVSLDRLHQISEILSKASAQSDGGNLGYAMADAVKVIDGVIAAFGAEPQRNPVLAYADSYRDMAERGVESIPVWSVITDLERNIAPLYTAPPASVVPTFDEWLAIRGDKPLGWVKDAMRESYEACRAAMLQGADVSLTHEGKNHHEDKLGMVNHLGDVTEKVEPVTQIEPVADLYGLTSPTGGETSFTFDAVEARDFIDGGWSCQEYVELERFQEAVSGNSPVIQDGWIPVSERMPNDKDFVWCWGYVSGWTESDGFEAYYDATRNKWWTIDDETVRKVTHWMPLPAAPLWE
ncbi:DUF551 domain-containing protein [Escherichia coli]|uniref:DUF551 domain-containing protein n=1 Tax=Escherichia coli TaxID=562 RepID=UPI00345C0778